MCVLWALGSAVYGCFTTTTKNQAAGLNNKRRAFMDTGQGLVDWNALKLSDLLLVEKEFESRSINRLITQKASGEDLLH